MDQAIVSSSQWQVVHRDMSPKFQVALNSFKAGLRGFPLFKPLANFAKASRAKTLQKYGINH